MKGLKNLAENFKREIGVYRLVLKDERTPAAAKLLLFLAVSYALMPFDLIPDFIPVLGQLDDIIIVPILVLLALMIIPAGVVEECRKKIPPQGGRR